MHSTRPRLPVRKTVVALVLFAGIRLVSAGMPDSVIAEPQLPSLRTAKTIERRLLQRIDDDCRCPGCIPGFNADTACFTPVLKYCKSFHAAENEAGDSAAPDSVTVRNYLIAMSAYHQLSTVKEADVPVFSHHRFLEYVTVDDEVTEKPWIVKIFERILNWLDIHVWAPLIRAVADRFGHKHIVRFVLTALLALTVFTIIVIISIQLIRRFYPLSDTADSHLPRKSAASGGIREIWLDKAAAAVSENRFDDAITCIYRHCTEWYTARNKIRRFEWWTNRQFLQLVKSGFSRDYDAATSIITAYEQCIFGHFSIDRSRITDLLSLASSLSGKRT